MPIQSSVGMLTSGIARAFATEQSKIGWLVPVGIQGVPSIIGLSLIFFTVESPRWLISKGREEDAVKALRKLRTQADVDAGLIELEVEAIHRAIEFDQTINNGTWRELFSGSYWRRAIVSHHIPPNKV